MKKINIKLCIIVWQYICTSNCMQHDVMITTKFSMWASFFMETVDMYAWYFKTE